MPRHLADAYSFDEPDEEDTTDTPTENVPKADRYLPPDPGLVEHDLTIDELDELPVDAIDDLEALEDIDELASIDDFEAAEGVQRMSFGGDDHDGAYEDDGTDEDEPAEHEVFDASDPDGDGLPTPRRAFQVPLSAAAAQPATPGLEAPADAEPLTAAQLYTRMFGAFFGSMAASFLLVLVPWMLLVSPALEASRQAREPRVVQVPQPVVVEKVVPVPVPVPPPVAEDVEQTAQDGEAPAEPTEERTDGEPTSPEAATAKPDPVPVARPTPRAAPKPTPRVRPRPTPRAKPKPSPQPKPTPRAVVPKPSPAPAPTEAPAQPIPAPAAAPPPAPVKTPPEALALNGRMRGKAAGDPLYVQVLLRSRGRATMHVKRGTAPWKSATGTYTLNGSTAQLSVTEPDGGPSYQLTVDSSGAEGTIVLDGKEKPVKVKR